VESQTILDLPLNGRDWTSLATLEPGVLSIPNQATASFSANKGNRGFGNQMSNSGHRANENTYRVNGITFNDYSNAAPGGATGVNLGVNGATTAFGVALGSINGALNLDVAAGDIERWVGFGKSEFLCFSKSLLIGPAILAHAREDGVARSVDDSQQGIDAIGEEAAGKGVDDGNSAAATGFEGDAGVVGTSERE